MNTITTTTKIDKGVPIPEFKKVLKWPCDLLEVGDSFLGAGVKHLSFHQNCIYYGRKLKKKFVCKPEGENIRVWRTE